MAMQPTQISCYLLSPNVNVIVRFLLSRDCLVTSALSSVSQGGHTLHHAAALICHTVSRVTEDVTQRVTGCHN